MAASHVSVYFGDRRENQSDWQLILMQDLHMKYFCLRQETMTVT